MLPVDASVDTVDLDLHPNDAFPGERSVEGLAKMPSETFLYVVDRDHDVHLRFLMAD